MAFTLHINQNTNYNGIHPYAYLTKNDYNVGLFYNSLEQVSLFSSKKFYIGNSGLNVEVGAATGYETDVVPMARINYKNVYFMPYKDDNEIKPIVGFAMDF